MDEATFAEMLKKEILLRTDGEIRIGQKAIRKNNDVMMQALILSGDDTKIAPTFYLKPLYRQFLDGTPLASLADYVTEHFRRTQESAIDPMEFFTQYDKISSSIYCRLVSRQYNQEILEDLCSEDWEDLAVTFYYKAAMPDGEDGIIQIRKSFLFTWGITAEYLAKDAWVNTLRDYPAVFLPLGEVLGEYESGQNYTDEEEKDPVFAGREIPLYLLTNSEKAFGAVCIAYPGMLREIAGKLGGSYYVLPSSIHECLILKETGEHSAEDLSAMVKELNETQVERQEILADHVYYYSRKKGRLEYAGSI